MGTQKTAGSTLLLALGLCSTVLLNGCGGGGASNQTFAPFTPSGPVVNGLQATAASPGQTTKVFVEVSGAAAPGGATTAFLTGAVASDALPINGVQNPDTKTIPLGFSPGGVYVDNTTFGTALHPGDPFIFGASITNGSDAAGNVIPISGVQISSTDLTLAAQPLTFLDTQNFKGPLANAGYRSATLTVPAGTTTGLKTLALQVSDKAPSAARHSPSTTTFDVVVLAGGDAAVVAQIVDADGAPVVGATATVTGADAPGYVGPLQAAPAGATASVSDSQGMVILFAAPGAADATTGATNTVTVTSSDGTLTATAPVTLTADQALTSPDGKNALTITLK